jgi:hypothetical protein
LVRVAGGGFAFGSRAAGVAVVLELGWRRPGAGLDDALAFLLRLAAGIGLSTALPHWGYPKAEQQAGYLFKDAYNRDYQAWSLAQSSQPLWASFREEFVTDQYGGVLALSALVYRYISPDAHRPFLILILGAFVFALGVPFLVQAARLRWSARIAVLAGWIYVLYPDAIFFASAQMREPFLIGLAAVAFWGVLAWNRRRSAAAAALGISLLVMALISSRVAGAVAGFLGLLFLLEYVIGSRTAAGRRLAGWGLCLEHSADRLLMGMVPQLDCLGYQCYPKRFGLDRKADR